MAHAEIRAEWESSGLMVDPTCPPAGLEWLKEMTCPSSRGAGQGYEFLKLTVLRQCIDCRMDPPIMWDKKGNHKGVRNVLFWSGRVDTVEEGRFTELLHAVPGFLKNAGRLRSSKSADK
ncbi:hypothetical protein HQ576_05745 [bacterium]|nr:hypothetical protein [bacterium]